MISPPRAGGPALRFGKSYAEIARLSGDIRAFLAMAEGLRALGYSTPRIHALSARRRARADRGFRRRDHRRGQRSQRVALRRGDVAARRPASARRCRARLPVDGETYMLPTYDIEAMLIEVELALDWYAPAIARGNPSSGARMQFLALWREHSGARARAADDLDAARLPLAESALAPRARRAEAARPDRFSGRGARAARL